MVTIDAASELAKTKGFKVLVVHLNCQSLYHKLNQQEETFCDIDNLCLSETWLHDAYVDHMLNITGKIIFIWDRSNGVSN